MEIRKLAPGDRVLDYRLLERLGEGGFGEVFRAEHEVLGRIVAIKVPRDQTGLTALRHEGVVQASLSHPNIVKTLELSISHDPPYVVMEFIDGCSLAELIRREGPLSWRRAARILKEAATALAHAHAQGVVHGDVKPGNILVEPGRRGRVLLTDFGLGRVFEGPQGNLQISRSLELASSGAEVQGTIRYLAPELLRGESVDERADLYSFGVLLFEALTGRLPEGREVPSDLVRDLPPEIDRMFARTFTRRERRPRSFESTLEELDGLLLAGKGKKKAKDGPAPAKATGSTAAPVVRAVPAAAPAAPSRLRCRAKRAVAAAARTAAEPKGPFDRRRDAIIEGVKRRISLRGLSVGEGHGFDVCFGVNNEGEPHHRVYALVVDSVDAASARSIVAQARRIFEREKGIWEKEVTFCVLADEVREREQVLWTFKSFSMGWWRRRRMILQDLENERVFATELGCDPQGNPLKRAFLTAATEAAREVPREVPVLPEPGSGVPGHRVGAKGTAWGVALALVMAFGVLGTFMGVQCARRSLEDAESGPRSAPILVSGDEDGASCCDVVEEDGEAEPLPAEPVSDDAPASVVPGCAPEAPACAEGATRDDEPAPTAEPAEAPDAAEVVPAPETSPVPEREPDAFTPATPVEERVF